MNVTFGKFTELSKAADTKLRTASADMSIYRDGEVVGHIRKLVETLTFKAWGRSKSYRRVARYELHVKGHPAQVFHQNPPTRWLSSVKAAAKTKLTAA